MRNSWPNELGGALLFFPLNLFLGWELYRKNQWSFETRGQPLEWELFVTYLLLAIGVASGLLLLMAVGWICMGFAWMRPTRIQWPGANGLNCHSFFFFVFRFFSIYPAVDMIGSTFSEPVPPT